MSSRRWKGIRDLLFDGVEVVTDLVQRTHHDVSDRWADRASHIEPNVAKTANEVHKAATGVTYDTIRLVNRGVQAAAVAITDPMLREPVGGESSSIEPSSTEPSSTEPSSTEPSAAERAAPEDGSAAWWADQVESTLNGFVGDFLAERDNGLALNMSFREHGARASVQQLAAVGTAPKTKLVVFVHGLSASEWCWQMFSEKFWGKPGVSYGSKLEAEQGYRSLFVRYNSGRHISDNGKALSLLLDELVRDWPVPIDDLVVVGHSMGGLVSRSAAHYGATEGLAWIQSLNHLFCIGSPHLGAPLEQGASLLAHVLNRVPAAGANVPGAVLDARSAGIKDLRYGYTVDEEWADEDGQPKAKLSDDRFELPLVDGVNYYAVATTITRNTDDSVGELLGDLLVRPASATATHRIPFHSTVVLPGMNHLHNCNHPDVFGVLAQCLSEPLPGT